MRFFQFTKKMSHYNTFITPQLFFFFFVHTLTVKPDPPERVTATPIHSNPRRLEVSWQSPATWPDIDSFPLKYFLRYRPLIREQWQHVSTALDVTYSITSNQLIKYRSYFQISLKVDMKYMVQTSKIFKHIIISVKEIVNFETRTLKADVSSDFTIYIFLLFNHSHQQPYQVSCSK